MCYKKFFKKKNKMKIYVFILRRAQIKKLEAPLETIEATACQKYTRT